MDLIKNQLSDKSGHCDELYWFLEPFC